MHLSDQEHALCFDLSRKYKTLHEQNQKNEFNLSLFFLPHDSGVGAIPGSWYRNNKPNSQIGFQRQALMKASVGEAYERLGLHSRFQ